MKLHRNVSPRQEILAEKKLFTAVAALRTAEECKAFFKDLCTPAELQAMADRWAVVEYVQKGLPYREIHRLTGVSVTTIGRVARFVAAGNGGYQLASQRIEGHSKRNGDASRRPEASRHG
jgi:TrpR-related protein YerC/YecD